MQHDKKTEKKPLIVASDRVRELSETRSFYDDVDRMRPPNVGNFYDDFDRMRPPN